MSHRWPAVVARTAARRVLADPGATVVQVAFYALIVVVISALWRSAVAANGGQLAGYGAAAVTWYLATSEAAVVALPPRLIEETGDDIGSGAVAVELLRPVPALGVRVAGQVGRAVPRLACLAVVGSVVAVAVVGAPPDGVALALAIPALVLAVACNVVAQHAFAAAAFWLRDAQSAWYLYQKVVFIVGGMLLPLEVLPGWLHSVASVLPFAAMAYAPARLASGHAEPALLALQVGWLAGLAALAAALFAAGERRLQVVGG